MDMDMDREEIQMVSIHQRISQFLHGAWRQRYVILIPMLIVPILGSIIGAYSPKKYSSHTSLLIQETAKMNPFLEDFAVSPRLDERMSALKTLLHSRHILRSVGLDTGLIVDGDSAEKQDRVIAEISSRLSLSVMSKDLYKLEYRHSDPADMKKHLEAVSDHFINELLAPERSSIDNSTSFLSKQLVKRKNDLKIAEDQLAAFVNEHGGFLPDMRAANNNRLAAMKQRQSEVEALLAGAKKSLGGLEQQITQTDPTLGLIEKEIVKINSDIAALRTRYTDKHSKVVSAMRKLDRLEKERNAILSKPQSESSTNTTLDALWDMARGIEQSEEEGGPSLLISQLKALQSNQSRVDSLQEEEAQLEKMISNLESKSQNMGSLEQTMYELERDLNVKRSLYEDLLERHEMAQITGSLSHFESRDRVKVIDKPFAPTNPSNPPLVLFIIAGFIGGLALGGGLAVIFEWFDPRVRSRDEIEKICGAAVICRLPKMTI